MHLTPLKMFFVAVQSDFFSRIWRDRSPYSKFIETEQKNREYKEGEEQ
jgi:hypothetical protein